MIQSVFGHRGIVTCVSFSTEDGLHGNKGDGLIGSGSQDTTVLLWKWSGKLNRVTGPLSIIEGKYFILINEDCLMLNIVVSVFQTPLCLLLC